jgi:glycosyltransferase involved in cell wall biosynthesis
MSRSDPLRIVLFVSKAEWSGGIGSIVAGLARSVAARGNEVHVAGPPPPGTTPPPIQGVSLHLWPKRRLKARQVGPLLRLLRETRADVLHLHSALPHAELIAAARLYRLLTGRPRIFVSAHTSVRSNYPKRRARLGLRLADALVQSNTWSAENAIRAGARRDTTHILNNGVEPAERVLPPEKRDRLVLMMGRFVPAKGVDVLIDAFHRAGAPRPDWRLVCAGSGRDEVALRQQASAGPCAGRIELPGWLEGERRLDLLERAAIGVVASRAENSPQSLQYLQAHGLACIATEIGGIPDLARDDGALLVPSEDPETLAGALATLMDSADRRRQLSEGALRRAADLTWPKIAERLEALYRRYLPA